MIFFFKSDGTLIKSAPDTVYQGSTEAGKIYVVMPFNAKAAADVYFRLPNGENWGPYILTNHGVVTDVADVPTGWGLWSVDLESAITQYAGTLTAQFGFTQASGKIEEGETEKYPLLTTNAVTIKIAKGVTRYLPEEPSYDVYEVIKKSVNAINEKLDGVSENWLTRTGEATIALKNNGWIGYSTEAAENTLALRDSNGRLKASDGVANDDVATVKQLNKLSDATNLENGTGENSVQQKYIENNVDYSAQATGKNAAAFGGKRFDKLTDASRTPTSAEGNQAFAAGGSTHAMADFTTAFGKDGIAYQKGSFVAAMAGQAGKSEADFNAYYWDAVNNVALHKGQGKKDGKITDEFGKTYDESYSAAATFGDGNKAKGYGDFVAGAGNKTDGVGNAAFGKGNNIESGSSCFVGGENNKMTGDVGNSLLYGQGLKNDGRWNKTVLGQYNAPNNYNVFEFGAGTSDSARRNAMEIKDDGAVVFGNGQSFKSGTRFQVSSSYRKLVDTRNNGVTHIESYVDALNGSIGSNNSVNGKKISDPTQGNYKLLNTFMAGEGLQNNGRYNQTIVGQYNEYNANALFQVGTGESDTNRKSGFEVLWNGRVKVKGKPIEKDDVVRLQELDANKVVANPTLAGTEAELTGLQVGDTKYKVPTEAGGGRLYRHQITIEAGVYVIYLILIDTYNTEYTAKTFSSYYPQGKDGLGIPATCGKFEETEYGTKYLANGGAISVSISPNGEGVWYFGCLNGNVSVFQGIGVIDSFTDTVTEV